MEAIQKASGAGWRARCEERRLARLELERRHGARCALRVSIMEVHTHMCVTHAWPSWSGDALRAVRDSRSPMRACRRLYMSLDALGSLVSACRLSAPHSMAAAQYISGFIMAAEYHSLAVKVNFIRVEPRLTKRSQLNQKSPARGGLGYGGLGSFDVLFLNPQKSNI